MADESHMTLLAHLDELRSRIGRSLIVFLVAVFLSFSFLYDVTKQVLVAPLQSLDPSTPNVLARHNPVLRMLRPYVAGGRQVEPIQLHAMTVTEVFVVKFKMALLCGLILSAPFLLYQAWAFIGAGLLPRERGMVRLYLPFSLALFATGMVFAYFAVIPVALLYLLTVDPEIKLVLMYGEYFGLIVLMLAMFGLAFQLPLVTMALARLGIVPAKTLARSRRYAIVIIFIVAAILTPSPEPFSQCLLAMPMIGLYELGIWLARGAEKKARA